MAHKRVEACAAERLPLLLLQRCPANLPVTDTAPASRAALPQSRGHAGGRHPASASQPQTR
eukprot:543892-Rhodomonas_salina.1